MDSRMTRLGGTVVMVAMLAALAMVAPAAAQQPKAAKAHAAKPKPKERTFQGRTLTSWLQDLGASAPVTRVSACYAIADFGADGKPAVSALVKALDDAAPTVRYSCGYALGEIGPDAVEALPRLEKMTDDQSDDLAHIARKSIKKIKGEIPFGEPKGAPSR